MGVFQTTEPMEHQETAKNATVPKKKGGSPTALENAKGNNPSSNTSRE